MTAKNIRIRLINNLDDATAATLGGRIERDDVVEFVADSLDESQISGLLIQLDNLCLPFDRVEIDGADGRPRGTRSAARASKGQRS